MYEATFEIKHLKKAIQLAEKAMANFEDKLNGGCFMNDKSMENLIIRPKERYDGAMPCGNSVMGYVLLKLSRITGKQDIAEVAKRQTEYLAKVAGGHLSYGVIPLMMQYYPSTEIVAVAENYNKLDSLRGKTREFCPNTSFAAKFTQTPDASEHSAFFRDYSIKNNATTYYVCENKTCNVLNKL